MMLTMCGWRETLDSFTQVMHPHDHQYVLKRRQMLDAQAHLSEIALDRQIQYLMSSPAPAEQNENVWKRLNADLRTMPFVPDSAKAILDSTGGGTSGGSVMIRQDLEVPLYLLFVKRFPLFDAIRHAPSNGLVHAANQVTALDGNALGASALATESTAVP
jgi:hypothetical protein